MCGSEVAASDGRGEKNVERDASLYYRRAAGMSAQESAGEREAVDGDGQRSAPLEGRGDKLDRMSRQIWKRWKLFRLRPWALQRVGSSERSVWQF